MMNDDVPEMFRQMDAMMARLMRGMDAGFAGSSSAEPYHHTIYRKIFP